MKIVFWLLNFLLITAPLLAQEVAAEAGLKGAISKGIHDVSIALLEALIPILAILAGMILKGILKNIKIGFVRSLVRRWVLSAYQNHTSGDHAAKFDEVAKKVSAKFKYVSEAEIKDLIDEAIAEIKIELSKELGKEK